jgi:hypothetical protein|tara:strand:+ start:84 stop:878 length:795 start_codon:yes stop_codon:yes gene_type:complete
MAINVNQVYSTVLTILNKEQRGYITPDEFNKISTQSQLEIFEQYFEDLNQQLRVPQADVDYSDRIENIDERIAIFKTFGDATYDTTTPTNPFWNLPAIDGYGNTIIYSGVEPVNPPFPSTTVSFYRIGTVTYNSSSNPVEIQRLQRSDYYQIQRSPLTRATNSFPNYLYENNKLYISPNTIISVGDITVDFVRKPRNVVWGYSLGAVGQYVYDPATSQNFELSESEQTSLIIKILLYSGVIIKDPQLIQIAAAEEQAIEVNQKS